MYPNLIHMPYRIMYVYITWGNTYWSTNGTTSQITSGKRLSTCNKSLVWEPGIELFDGAGVFRKYIFHGLLKSLLWHWTLNDLNSTFTDKVFSYFVFFLDGARLVCIHSLLIHYQRIRPRPIILYNSDPSIRDLF